VPHGTLRPTAANSLCQCMIPNPLRYYHCDSCLNISLRRLQSDVTKLNWTELTRFISFWQTCQWTSKVDVNGWRVRERSHICHRRCYTVFTAMHLYACSLASSSNTKTCQFTSVQSCRSERAFTILADNGVNQSSTSGGYMRQERNAAGVG